MINYLSFQSECLDMSELLYPALVIKLKEILLDEK